MTDHEELHVYPFDIEVEQATLGALLLDISLLPRALEWCNADDFYDPLHARIMETIIALTDAGRSATPLTVNAELKGDPGLIEVGGHAYFVGLAEAAPALPNVRDYALIIRECATKRAALYAMEDASAAIRRTSLPLTLTMAGVSSVIEEAAVRAARKRPKTADELGLSIIEQAEKREAPPSVTTGLDRLNEAIGGFYPTDFILVPGQSGMGKSALLGGFALRAAMAGHPVKVFSLDMRAEDWWARTLCDVDYDLKDWNEQSIWYERIRKGQLKDHEFGRLEMARQRVHGIPLEIDDERDLSMLDISARSKNFAARHKGKLGLIVVDYAQKVRSLLGKNASREQEVASIAVGLKNLAGSEATGQWPVVAGAQVNRIGEEEPTPDNIRESAALFNEADTVIAVHRKSYFVAQQRPDADAGQHEMDAWKGKMADVRHKIKLLALKVRHGSPAHDLTLHVDIGANAVRDHAPKGAAMPPIPDTDLLSLAGNQ